MRTTVRRGPVSDACEEVLALAQCLTGAERWLVLLVGAAWWHGTPFLARFGLPTESGRSRKDVDQGIEAQSGQAAHGRAIDDQALKIRPRSKSTRC